MHVHDPSPRPRRPRPPWLITDDYHDVELGVLKAGKEAEVFVVERVAGDRSCLLAHKRYRPRKVTKKGELEALGFSRVNSFMNDLEYRDGRKYAKSRDRRAVERMTNYGRELLTHKWPGHELDVMSRLWEAGADVPYPVGGTSDGLLLEYVGDATSAAPRLAQARLGPDDVVRAFDQLVANLEIFTETGFVHADLSAYNVLWWDGKLSFIDFPQAVDLAQSPHALDYLHRDVTNVCTWFNRHGKPCDAEALFADLLSCAFRS